LLTSEIGPMLPFLVPPVLGLPVHLMSKVPFSALRCSIKDRHA
jgi:hypothetical protein